MRRGEILALTWEFVHVDRDAIEVMQAWKDRHELGLPKWDKTRTTPMPSLLAEAFKTLKKRGKHIGDQDLVFCYKDGSRFGGT
jgi:integrase